MEQITKQFAITNNLTRFFNGIPCKKGHIAERYTKNGYCCLCAKAAFALRYQKNKDRLLKNSKSTYPNKRKSILARHKLYYSVNKIAILIKMKANKLAVSEEILINLFNNSNGLCDLCGNPETRTHKSGTPHSLSIDHSHTSNKIRGLLCSKCNRGLGHFDDSLEKLEAAISYLKDRT